jgi:cytochrome P450
MAHKIFSGAGADSVTFALCACVMLVCKRPQVYQRLQAELDDFYANNLPSHRISYVETQSLPYLDAVCREASRLYPAISFQLLRNPPRSGLVVRDVRLPANCVVGISAWAQNRDIEVFGADADEFRPERWLESEKRKREMEAADLTWGGTGSRGCQGKNIALVEVHKCIVSSLESICSSVRVCFSLLWLT